MSKARLKSLVRMPEESPYFELLATASIPPRAHATSGQQTKSLVGEDAMSGLTSVTMGG